MGVGARYELFFWCLLFSVLIGCCPDFRFAAANSFLVGQVHVGLCVDCCCRFSTQVSFPATDFAGWEIAQL
jgi:hypothetical protein